MEEQGTSRLGVVDKRHLFQSLIAMVDRLLFLNRFPVDQADFALSCQPPGVEAAWRLLRDTNKNSLSPVSSNAVGIKDVQFQLHLYPEERTRNGGRVFMNIRNPIEIPKNNRFRQAVEIRAKRQLRLEDQILRADKVIKAIVHSCNTVGQYKRVSPDLLTFLPDKYKLALKDYTKQSPYPAITVEPHEIETTMATLAYAALQPPHSCEENYNRRPTWGHNRYNLTQFPRSSGFDGEGVRRLVL